jgi:hypothetical protein
MTRVRVVQVLSDELELVRNYRALPEYERAAFARVIAQRATLHRLLPANDVGRVVVKLVPSVDVGPES